MENKNKYKQKIFDTEFGEYRTYLDFAEEYGFEFADSILKMQQAKSKSDPGPTENQNAEPRQSAQILNFIPNKNSHKQQPIDGQFLALEYDRFFGNEMVMKSLASKAMLFLFLLKNKVDWNKNEKLNLYQDYFVDRRLVVASVSRAVLATTFGCAVRTITNWLNQLERDGLIKIERIACDDDDDRRHKYNVIILGRVLEDGTVRFLYEKK